MDKNVHPKFMHVDRQVQSIHAWHQYTSLHCFDLQSVSDSLTLHLKDIKAVGVNEFLPSAANTVSICSNYIVLVSHILVERLHFLHEYADCVPKHISHALTPEMSQKSTVIPLGVIPKNENKNEELIALLEQVRKYVPQKPGGDPHTCIMAGDQLTSECIYNVQLIRAASTSARTRLDCFLSTHSD